MEVFPIVRWSKRQQKHAEALQNFEPAITHLELALGNTDPVVSETRAEVTSEM